MASAPPLPARIESGAELDELLTRPSADLVAAMRRIEGDLVILGVAGKMGVTLAGLAARASRDAGRKRRVIGVARFTEPGSREALEAFGAEAVTADLLDPDAVARLPDAPNVIFMAGRKFGTVDSEPLTWAMNTLVPAHAARRYAKSRIVAFSTGCVYPLWPVESCGPTEDDPAGPVGEYSQSCLGRERIFAHFSRTHATPVLLFRLNYAIDLRYGVLLEIGRKVAAGQPVDLRMGHVNVIWQGDANERALRCLEHCASPEAVLNVTGPEVATVRAIASEFGRHLGRAPLFEGEELPSALLSNAARSIRLFGPPRVGLERMIAWTAHWIRIGGPTLDKPTHYESATHGKY